MNIYCFSCNGFEEAEAVVVVDILRRAKLSVKWVSLENTKLITSSHDVTIKTDLLFDDVALKQEDWIFIPGGMPGVTNISKHQEFMKILTTHVTNQGCVAAICAAPSLLGQLDLLKGRNYTCYPGFETYISNGNLIDNEVVVAGNIITGRALGAGLNFALTIISKISGIEKANEIAKSICFTYDLNKVSKS